jgi:membrane-associated phospholipid phosphatase
MKAPLQDRARATQLGALPAVIRLIAVLGRNVRKNIGQWCRAVARPPRMRIPGPPATAIVLIIVTLAIVVASMFLIDAAATDWARHLPEWFTEEFEQITNAGESGWPLISSALLVLLFAGLTSAALPLMTGGVLAALAARLGFLFIAVGAPGLFTTIVKRLIGRARPYMELHNDPFTYVPFAWRPEYASLPSGHATTAVATAFAISVMWPRTRWFMWLYALVIMFSRVVVQSHHPSDAIAGALVGFVGAALVRRWFAARRLVFSAHDLSAYPGPSLRRVKAAIGRAIFVAWGDARRPETGG